MSKAPAKDNTDGAQKGQVLSGKKFWGLTGGQWGPQTGSMPNNGATILTPGMGNVAIPVGYHNGAGYVAAIYPRGPVHRTGQTDVEATGDDGSHQKGMDWPSPRFTDNGDGTITDNMTNLVWLKDATCDDLGTTGYGPWATAIAAANALYDITPNPSSGDCGLSDGSSAGDWRLANVRELESLLDYGAWTTSHSFVLPSGHPFVGASSSWYWTSTKDHTDGTDNTYLVMRIYNGERGGHYKTGNYYMWPVRDP
jgi:hypothetical protein